MAAAKLLVQVPASKTSMEKKKKRRKGVFEDEQFDKSRLSMRCPVSRDSKNLERRCVCGNVYERATTCGLTSATCYTAGLGKLEFDIFENLRLTSWIPFCYRRKIISFAFWGRCLDFLASRDKHFVKRLIRRWHCIHKFFRKTYEFFHCHEVFLKLHTWKVLFQVEDAIGRLKVNKFSCNFLPHFSEVS